MYPSCSWDSFQVPSRWLERARVVWFWQEPIETENRSLAHLLLEGEVVKELWSSLSTKNGLQQTAASASLIGSFSWTCLEVEHGMLRSASGVGREQPLKWNSFCLESSWSVSDETFGWFQLLQKKSQAGSFKPEISDFPCPGFVTVLGYNFVGTPSREITQKI